MKKLKIILQSKYVILICTVFLIGYLGINLRKIPCDEKILNNNSIEGIVRAVDDKSIIVKNVIIFYNDAISIGDKVICKGTYSLPNQRTNFYTFDYQKFLASKKVYYIMDGECTIVSHSDSIIIKFKNAIERYFKIFESKDYLYAFILGQTNLIDEDIMNSYNLNGIIHLFSISGMHIGFIVSLLSFIKKKWIISIILLIYLALLGYPPSMTRAVLFYILVTLNKKVGMDNKILFFYLLLFMLINNPFYVYNIGFIYSYLISYFLIIYSDMFYSKSYFNNLLKSSFIIFLITIPINIQNSHYLNFLSPFFNVLFIPIVTLLLFPLAFLILLLPFFDHSYYIICTIFEIFSLWLSKIDYFIFSFKYMNLWVFLFYYILIIFILNKFRYYEYKYVVFLIILLFIHLLYPYIDRNTYITFLDVDQGDSTLINVSGTSILMDTGGIYSSPLTNKTIIPVLRSQGLNKINYLILTHGDYDHMGEAINLVNNFKVEKVIFNCGEFNELEQDLIKVLDKKKIKYYSCTKELNIDNNKLYFLNNEDYGNENDNSIVIYTELNNYKFLFMGDAGVEVENDLTQKYNLQDIDVLKVGHHGSRTSSSEEFINYINPKYSIISVGKNNRYGHPNKGVLNVLDNSKIYRTDENGSIIFKIKKNKLKIEMCIS